MNILFDSMGTQVQVMNDGNKQDSQRLATWLDALSTAGYNVNFTNFEEPISNQSDPALQLANNNLLITTTRQWAQQGHSNIPGGTDFGYVWSDTDGSVINDLAGIQEWVLAGNSILYFTNHNQFGGTGPFWPVNDIQLAAAFGITFTFAAFTGPGGNMTMTPNPDAPAALINGVSSVVAFDSGGICTSLMAPNVTSTVLVPLPSNCTDKSMLGYPTADFAFATLYSVGNGAGNIIVIGHSGIVGTAGTSFPSPGQISVADNLPFLMNCVDFLTGNSQSSAAAKKSKKAQSA